MTRADPNTAILNALRKEFAETILPRLEGADRYTGAMMKRALDVLAARAQQPDPALALNVAGYGTPETLAAQLRGQPGQTPELSAALRTYVEAKLRISNPKFLTATKAATEGADT
ncbi:hypothetical protein GI582_25085 [Sulfitobacter sp. BDSS02]|nr:hypothetical protein [Sulfitobacter sp. BDSS02]MBR9852665.1 hypothetical protein [Paracoccaceae bacterium]